MMDFIHLEQPNSTLLSLFKLTFIEYLVPVLKTVIVLVSFSCQLDGASSDPKESQLRGCLDQTGLWSHPWGIVFIDH